MSLNLMLLVKRIPFIFVSKPNVYIWCSVKLRLENTDQYSKIVTEKSVADEERGTELCLCTLNSTLWSPVVIFGHY